MGARSRRSFLQVARPLLSLRVLGAAVLVAALLIALVALPAFGTSFTDVADSHRYAPAIQELGNRGIIAGYGDGRFGPEDLVLRQQFAKVIILTLGLPVSEADICPFPDVQVSGPGGLYPDNYVAVAAARGITLGTSPQTFSPYDHITRAQVITMVVRAADNLYPGLLITPPPDYQSTWDPTFSPDHGQNARRAERNGLLDVIPLETLDPWAPMPRGEVAQVLHNLLMKVAPPSTTTTQSPTTTTTEPGPETVPIASLKGPEYERYVGREVTVEGIFVRDPLPMLVTDLDVVLANSRMPEQSYIVLMGPMAEEIPPGELGGSILTVTGRVDLDVPEAAADTSLLVTSSYDPAKYVVLADIEFRLQEQMAVYDPKMIDIAMVENPNPDPRRWAILFSGGVDKANNHTRYWNDLTFMYSTLVGPLGFPANNIAVLHADGTVKDTSMPVHYAATEANLATVFDLLREHSRSNDLIFVFTTNHGAGFDTSKLGFNCLAGGQLDGDSDEPGESLSESTYFVDVTGNGTMTDTFAWDEALNAWQGASTTAADEILDDALQGIFANLNFNRMVIVMEQCFSGGLIHDLAQGGNRVIMSAASEHEPSWSMPATGNAYNEFSYHFTSAVRGSDHQGNLVDADTNNNGEVSMVEAFNYARTKDSRSETPHYEDSGDGIPHSGAMPGSGEGTLGAGTSLEP